MVKDRGGPNKTFEFGTLGKESVVSKKTIYVVLLREKLYVTYSPSL